MNKSDWEKTQELYWAGRDLGPRARRSLLMEGYPDDPALRGEVEVLWADSEEDPALFDFEALPGIAMRIFLENRIDSEQPPHRR